MPGPDVPPSNSVAPVATLAAVPPEVTTLDTVTTDTGTPHGLFTVVFWQCLNDHPSGLLDDVMGKVGLYYRHVVHFPSMPVSIVPDARVQSF